MALTRKVAKLRDAFLVAEGHAKRGPRFKELALVLERAITSAPGLPTATVLECFGPPDLWNEAGDGDGIFIYWFDHELPGSGRDEWYFLFTGGHVTTSGYNHRGSNPHLSPLKTQGEWPATGG